MSMLDRIKVASPCSADWNLMKGDDRVRFCSHCEKNVYNLSAMSRAQAEVLLRDKAGELCTRFYRRQDGTILTEDFPLSCARRPFVSGDAPNSPSRGCSVLAAPLTRRAVLPRKPS